MNTTLTTLRRWSIGTALGLTISLSSFASPAGHIDFADLSQVYGEPKVEVNLNATLIGMVSSLSKKEDPEVSALLSKIEYIKVRVYNLSGDASKALETVTRVTKDIRGDNWQPIVSINEKDQQVRVFTKITDDIIDGLVVMIVDTQQEDGGDQGEAVFINVVGEIDPSQISRVTDSLNIDMGDAL